MNSEHKSKNLQNIVKKYNIKKYERIDRCRYKIEIFNSVIIKDIYNGWLSFFENNITNLSSPVSISVVVYISTGYTSFFT